MLCLVPKRKAKSSEEEKIEIPKSRNGEISSGIRAAATRRRRRRSKFPNQEIPQEHWNPRSSSEEEEE
jgi:hypothetical protein